MCSHSRQTYIKIPSHPTPTHPEYVFLDWVGSGWVRSCFHCLENETKTKNGMGETEQAFPKKYGAIKM